ncbi:integral membrane protein [Ophiostoma piceae UAMH 11346]|uniref:Integral membrane protein n=1 Tax=Ophiostoma piceae (strain UAMH 11346) TaxID=1262450 RepID=S3CAE3_OPHP1|nr:integral membrane protein [Ophiostoma piceae UAMH 11346]
MDASLYGVSVASARVYDPEGARDTLAPLPPVLTRGLGAVATLGFASFISSALLFFFLTFKLVRWQLKPVSFDGQNASTPEQTADEPDSPKTYGNAFLVRNAHMCPQSQPGQPGYVDTTAKASQPPQSLWHRLRKEPPNQFLILIYNLLFADIQQASAFLLNVQWLVKNAVVVNTPICWAQGWFISTGDMASSVFVTAIAAHTYMGVVHGYRLPTWAFYSALVLLWCFVYGLAILGVIITKNGAGAGGLYVRAGAWCWVNAEYQDLRLYLHYLWIFLALGATTVFYIVIYIHIQKQKASTESPFMNQSHGEHYPNPSPSAGSPQAQPAPSTSASAGTESHANADANANVDSNPIKRLPAISQSARHPTFLLYPIIYVLCTTPLAAGRIASMAGRDVGLAYFCFAGAMIASAGWLDVALYSSTRRSIVFAGDAPPGQDTGLETFTFMRTPAGRKYGNIVFVHGGNGDINDNPKSHDGKRWRGWNDRVKSGPRLRIGGDRRGSSHSSLKGFGAGGGEAMGMAIQCDVVASITIEHGDRTIHERIENDERGYDRGDDSASLNSRMGIIKDGTTSKS